MTLRRRLLATVLVATLGFAGIAILVEVGTGRVDLQRQRAAGAERILRAVQAVELEAADFLREANEVIVFGGMSDEVSTPATVATSGERVTRSLDQLIDAIELDGSTGQLDEDRAQARGHAGALRESFTRLGKQVNTLVTAPPDPARLLAFHDAIESYERGFLSAIEEAVGLQQHNVDATSDELARVTERTRVLTVGLCGAVAAAVLLLLLVISRRVMAGVKHLETATRRIAAGDLSVELPRAGAGDELGQVAAAFADMAEALRRRTDEVNASHAEISAANQQLAESLRKVQEAQEQLVQSGKLAAVGQLAGGLAHEINNPLGVILGFAQGIHRRLKEGDPLFMPVGSIVREGLRCKALVQELLTFSRTARKSNEPCELNQVVESALFLVETKARTLGIAVVQELAADLPTIEANPIQLQQVVVNLGTNALDAMGEGGILTVRTGRCAGGLEIAVKDTGSGIPPEVVARMFEPFFTTKEVGKGTGLGLSLVHEMVRQHGGTIVVDTEVGRGTTMRIELPVAAERRESPRAVA
jgi:signal transduction histidine kinase